MKLSLELPCFHPGKLNAWLLFLSLLLPGNMEMTAAPSTHSAPLNVLFIAVDDLRDHLGYLGHPQVQTPNIDRLAAGGRVFERAYVQYPVCNPSRSSFLTGLRPDQTGVTNNTTRLRNGLPGAITLPQWFKEHGWHSAAFGKIFHLGGGRNESERKVWMDLPASWHSAVAYSPTSEGARKAAGRNLTGGRLNWCHWGAMEGGDEDQPDGQIARAVIERMEQLKDRPWFIGAGFMKPHDPFLAPKAYFDLYPLDELKLHQDPKDQSPAPPLAVGFGTYGEAFRAFTHQERLEFLRAYYACTTFMDAQVGKVLDALDRLGLRDRTLIVFLGDHGYHLGEREWWNKNTLFERSCRAPLIVSGPGIAPGRTRSLVEFIDLFPTVIEFSGLKAPHPLAGESLWPLLKDPNQPGRRETWTLVTRGGEQRGDSLRTDRWRYTEWSDGQRELYDHEVDPEETRNLVSVHTELVSELSSRLRQLRSPNQP